MEYAGDVVLVGSDVTKCRVGDRVSVDGFSAGPRSYGDYQKEGGFATYSIAPEARLSPVRTWPADMYTHVACEHSPLVLQEAIVQIDENFSYDEAATFGGAYETAHHALVHCAGVQPGETVLVHGATGTVGLAAGGGWDSNPCGHRLAHLSSLHSSCFPYLLLKFVWFRLTGFGFRDTAVQVCSALGANVVVTGGGDEKLETTRSVCLGAGTTLLP